MTAAGALALAMFFLAAGAGQARAASAIPAIGGTLTFTAPNVNGVLGGPPGTKVSVQGAGWVPFGNIALSLSNQPQNCTNLTLLGTYGTDGSGAFSINFAWPDTINQVGAYYLCGTQFSGGATYSSLSGNSFTLLSSAPASVSISAKTVAPGGTVTLTGSNWLPGPQTISLVLTPCNIGCTQSQAGQVTVQSGKDGSFSQPITISSSASVGSYYVQATNANGTITVSAGPLQVTNAATANGTPGTTIPATSTPQGAGVATPTSDNKTALKDGLLAGGAALLALLALIGGVAFLLSRSRGNVDLSRFERAAHERQALEDQANEANRSSRLGRSSPPDGKYRSSESASSPLASQPRNQRGARGSNPAGAASSTGSPDAEIYPWQRPRRRTGFMLPPPPGRQGPSAGNEEPPTSYGAPTRTPSED